MAGMPEVIDMKDWHQGTGSIAGFWLHVGRSLLAAEGADDMYGDFVPHNLNGEILTMSKTTTPYWQIYAPGFHNKVNLHRQLLQDYTNNLLTGMQAHHIDNDTNENCIENLEAIPEEQHASMHGAEGGRGNRGRGRGRGGKRFKRCW